MVTERGRHETGVPDSSAVSPAQSGSRRNVTLGSFSAGHLGDVLCISPLPRLLKMHYGWSVCVTDLPNTRAVFENNPFVQRFVSGSTISLDAIQSGDGHIIQRLFQGFELPVEPSPRPEVYLSKEEIDWAQAERRTWPSDKPFCIVSTTAISDGEVASRIDWQSLIQSLASRYTIIQPVLSEPTLRGVFPYHGLSARKYISLFSVADRFVGATSGGSHIAAAFRVPALVLVWRRLQEKIRFPIVGPVTVSELDWKAAFLYPYQWFVAAEDLQLESASSDIDRVLDQLDNCGLSGRPTAISNNPRSPCGFKPTPPVRIVSIGKQRRLIRIPAVYRDHGSVEPEQLRFG